MGTWTKASSGVWTMSGSAVRTVCVADSLFPGTAAARFHARQPADELRGVIRSSRDGRSCIEAGIVGSNAVIQSVTFGGAPSVLATAAHGLPAGTPFILEVRQVGNTCSIRLNGSASDTVSVSLGTTFADNRHWGFVSSVPGATCRPQICELVPDVSVPTVIGLAVCNGSISFTMDGTNYAPVSGGRGLLNASGPVGFAVYETTAYFFDGAHAVKVDLVTLTASLFTPAAGVLPGQTSAGTTTAYLAEVHGSRLVISDGRHLYNCAAGDPTDWNYSADTVGGAWATTVAYPGGIGSRIMALRSLGGVLLIGCEDSLWRMVGDRALGLPDIRRLDRGVGASGKDAIVPVSEGHALVHSPEGVWLWPVFGNPEPLSSPVLTEGIEFSRESLSTYRVTAVRDSERKLVWFGLSPVSGATAGTHFAYCERTGRFRADRGGWFPQLFPVSAGPSALGTYRGRVLIGGNDGYVRRLDSAVRLDDATTSIGARFSAFFPAPNVEQDSVLEMLAITPAENSGPVSFAMFGGRTAQEAWVGSGRWAGPTGSVTYDGARKPWLQGFAAPFIVVDFTNAANDIIDVEAVDARWSSQAGSMRRQRRVPAAPPAPAVTPPAPAADSGASPGPGGYFDSLWPHVLWPTQQQPETETPSESEQFEHELALALAGGGGVVAGHTVRPGVVPAGGRSGCRRTP